MYYSTLGNPQQYPSVRYGLNNKRQSRESTCIPCYLRGSDTFVVYKGKQKNEDEDEFVSRHLHPLITEKEVRPKISTFEFQFGKLDGSDLDYSL